MAEIHIERTHSLGLAKARKVAFQWAEQAEERLDMECTYEEGDADDLLSFSRAGVSGTLAVTSGRFELNAKLGFLLGAFKDRIEEEIVKNLDALIAKEPAKKTVKDGTTAATAKKPAVRKKSA